MGFSNPLKIGESKLLKNMEKVVGLVNELEPVFEKLTNEELREVTFDLKKRATNGAPLESLLPEAFANVREAAKRTINQRHYDVQILGGIALHTGAIAEMKTGEGKTLVATLPSYLNSLTGEGVHVVTVNDYLAERDAEWMGRIHQALGVSVGVITSLNSTESRQQAYNADITYGTNNEFGFDYLRDNMATSLSEIVQRGHHYAIVDEVDSILIDEARTPLIISGPADGNLEWYKTFAKIGAQLQADEDYLVDRKKRKVQILSSGINKTENILGIDNLYTSENTHLVGHLNNAIKAKELFLKDKEYVVTDKGEVTIVDEHTGRVMPDRRYNNGIHQAIEAKEKVPVLAENQTLATVTLQNYFKLYEKLSGMTGTAESEAAEFKHTYDLTVIPIPPHKPSARKDLDDAIFPSENGKFKAVVEEIVSRHEKGQPVLVGTVSVEKSEKLSKLLKQHKVPHKVLNAKNNEHEAKIVADAGKKGAVTVSTNMAGRGTDIMLGGNPEHIATVRLEKQGIYPKPENGIVTDGEVLDGEGFLEAEEYNTRWNEEVEKARKEVEEESEFVKSVGGLAVLGTERHESRRIDNQLRGRSGRQGDPGETQFFLSFEDEMVKQFNLEVAKNLLTHLNPEEDVPLQSKLANRLIQTTQTQMESQNFDMRKDILKYDNVADLQRKELYHQRRKILEQPMTEVVKSFVPHVCSEIVNEVFVNEYPEDWDFELLKTKFHQICPTTPADVFDTDTASLTRDEVVKSLTASVCMWWEEKETVYNKDVFSIFTQKVLLSAVNKNWKTHLYEMDYLKNGIGLRGFAQKDPVTEYRQESYELFTLMLENVKYDTIKFVSYLDPFYATKVTTPPLNTDRFRGSNGKPATVDVPTVAPSLEGLGLTVKPSRKTVRFRELLNPNLTVNNIDPNLAEVTIASYLQSSFAEQPPSGINEDNEGNTELNAVPKSSDSTNLKGSKRAQVNHNSKQTLPQTEPLQSKNSLCKCGSGKKFKRCHGK